MTRMRWDSAAITHEGRKRAHNEDAIIARPELGLWAVADGMGGHAAGDVASRMVTDALAEVSADEDFTRLVDAVDDALIQMNRRIREHSDEHFEGRTMGCTVVSLVSQGDIGVCLWAGDSRLYRVREGVMNQVSVDHDPLEELVEKGVLTPEEADEHPDSSVITRAVGGQPDLYLDVATFDMSPGDVYLLCSDGLYREVEREEIHAYLDSGEEAETVAQQLLEKALERGARDNVSVIVIRCLPA